MRVHLRFLFGLVAGVMLGIGIFIALLYLQLGVPTNRSGWIDEITRKKDALAAAIPGPRVLLCGGSGVAFGLDAELIEKGTGCRTVNMGTHAGLGLDYILYHIKKVARPGDTILLAIEYQLYAPPSAVNTETLDDYTLAHDPDYFRQTSLFTKIDMATRIPFDRIEKGLNHARHPEPKPWPAAPYVPGDLYINEFGDETGNGVVNRPPPRPAMNNRAVPLVDGMPSYHTPELNLLRHFLQWARENHVTVLSTFPNIVHQPEYDGPNARQAIKTLTDFYTAQGVPVIGSAQAAILPLDQFFDFAYHLTREGAIARTNRLVPELKPYLHPAPPPPPL
jgi:hypothetical protein